MATIPHGHDGTTAIITETFSKCDWQWYCENEDSSCGWKWACGENLDNHVFVAPPVHHTEPPQQEPQQEEEIPEVKDPPQEDQPQQEEPPQQEPPQDTPDETPPQEPEQMPESSPPLQEYQPSEPPVVTNTDQDTLGAPSSTTGEVNPVPIVVAILSVTGIWIVGMVLYLGWKRRRNSSEEHRPLDDPYWSTNIAPAAASTFTPTKAALHITNEFDHDEFELCTNPDCVICKHRVSFTPPGYKAYMDVV